MKFREVERLHILSRKPLVGMLEFKTAFQPTFTSPLPIATSHGQNSSTSAEAPLESHSTGFDEFDKLFGGNGFPSGRLINVTTDCQDGAGLLVIIPVVSS